MLAPSTMIAHYSTCAWFYSNRFVIPLTNDDSGIDITRKTPKKAQRMRYWKTANTSRLPFNPETIPGQAEISIGLPKNNSWRLLLRDFLQAGCQSRHSLNDVNMGAHRNGQGGGLTIPWKSWKVLSRNKQKNPSPKSVWTAATLLFREKRPRMIVPHRLFHFCIL